MVAGPPMGASTTIVSTRKRTNAYEVGDSLSNQYGAGHLLRSLANLAGLRLREHRTLLAAKTL